MKKNWANKDFQRFGEGWQELLLVGGALKAGLFDILAEGSLSTASLATKLKADTRAVGVVLEALVALDYVEKKRNTYKLTSEAKELLTKEESPNYLAHSIYHALRLVERWLNIPEVIETGRPGEYERTAEDRRHFIGSMECHAKEIAPHVVELCLKRPLEIKSVIDIGGGAGTYTKAFLQKGLKVTLFDLPEVIDLIKEKFKKDEAVELVGGDFNMSLPSGPYDLAFLSNVTHIYGPQQNQALFRRVATVLSPKKFIAILDFVRGKSLSAPLFAVNMLVNTENGGTWSKEEYYSWLEEAGFKNMEIFEIEPRDQQLILAQKA